MSRSWTADRLWPEVAGVRGASKTSSHPPVWRADYAPGKQTAALPYNIKAHVDFIAALARVPAGGADFDRLHTQAARARPLLAGGADGLHGLSAARGRQFHAAPAQSTGAGLLVDAGGNCHRSHHLR